MLKNFIIVKDFVFILFGMVLYFIKGIFCFYKLYCYNGNFYIRRMCEMFNY